MVGPLDVLSFSQQFMFFKQAIQSLIQLSFPIFRNFLPNNGRILPALTCNGSDPLCVNAGRILQGFGRKLGNIGELDCVTLGMDFLSERPITHF